MDELFLFFFGKFNCMNTFTCLRFLWQRFYHWDKKPKQTKKKHQNLHINTVTQFQTNTNSRSIKYQKKKLLFVRQNECTHNTVDCCYSTECQCSADACKKVELIQWGCMRTNERETDNGGKHTNNSLMHRDQPLVYQIRRRTNGKKIDETKLKIIRDEQTTKKFKFFESFSNVIAVITYGVSSSTLPSRISGQTNLCLFYNLIFLFAFFMFRFHLLLPLRFRFPRPHETPVRRQVPVECIQREMLFQFEICFQSLNNNESFT